MNLQNYETLKCVHSSVFWFTAGKHYTIVNTTPSTVEITSNFADTVTFDINHLNGDFIAFKLGKRKGKNE